MAGRRMVLTRDHLVRMLIDSEFYEAVPEFKHLQEVAMANWKGRRSGGCSRCGGMDWLAMQGVCDAFFLKLKELKREQSSALARIRQYLSAKKGYRVRKCVLYYRRSLQQKKPAKFEF